MNSSIVYTLKIARFRSTLITAFNRAKREILNLFYVPRKLLIGLFSIIKFISTEPHLKSASALIARNRPDDLKKAVNPRFEPTTSISGSSHITLSIAGLQNDC